MAEIPRAAAENPPGFTFLNYRITISIRLLDSLWSIRYASLCPDGVSVGYKRTSFIFTIGHK
jgi:hypothetical protein